MPKKRIRDVDSRPTKKRPEPARGDKDWCTKCDTGITFNQHGRWWIPGVDGSALCAVTSEDGDQAHAPKTFAVPPRLTYDTLGPKPQQERPLSDSDLIAMLAALVVCRLGPPPAIYERETATYDRLARELTRRGLL